MARPIRITLLGDASDLTDTLDEASQEVSAFGEKAAGLAAMAGAGIAAGIGLGIAEALNAEKSTDLLAAQLGASPAQAKTLGQAAGAVYSDGFGESVEDANAALKTLWQEGLIPAGATADEMANISKRAMDVAAVLGDEVGPTGIAVGQMLKTGMAKTAEEAFDILVKGAQNGGNKAEDLLETFNEYGTSFRSMGLDGKTAMGLIQQGLQGGAKDADKVADAVKEFSLVAGQGGEATEKVFDSIGLKGKEITRDVAAGGDAAKGAMDKVLDRLRAMPATAERAAAIKSLFGGPGEDLGAALFSLNVDKATAALGKVDGAAKAAGDTMHDNAANKLTAFTRGLQVTFVDFVGGYVIPALEGLARAFAPVGTAALNVGRWIGENRTPITIVAGLIGVLLLPALVAWGTTATTSAVANVIAWATSSASATGGAATQVLAHWAVVGGWLRAGGQAVISAALVVGGWIAMGAQAMIQGARMAAAWVMAMGPVGWIITAVVALAALIWANWDTIKTKTGEAFTWVWDKVSAVFTWLSDAFLNFTGVGFLIKHWDTIKQATAQAFQWVKDKARDGIQGVIDFFTGLPGAIGRTAGRMLRAALDIGSSVIDGLKDGLSNLGRFAGSIAGAVVRATKSAINSVVDLLNWAIPDRLGFGDFGIDLPKNPIPHVRAMGGPTSGLTRVGERGPEWLNLPGGTTVIPNHAAPSDGGIVVNVTSNADPHTIGRAVAWALRTVPR